MIEPGSNVDAYSPRDLFFFLINIEEYPEKLLIAKEFTLRAHAAAEVYMQADHPGTRYPGHFTFAPYDRVSTEKRILQIFDHLWKINYSDWVAEGMPLTEDACERYDLWWADTRKHMADWLLQRSPFNLTDGVWLRRAIPTGPITETEAILLATLTDELGNGDVSQNHCNCFLDILKSLGINPPDVRTRAFADQEAVLSSAFVKPVLTLATSIYSKTFFPEILGYNLWLELTSPPEHAPAAKLLERYALNPSFSLLHTAIDNVENGHARNAIRAVQKYLDDVEARLGPDAVQEHWRRIWIGYVAYATTGDFLPDLRSKLRAEKATTARDKFTELIGKKARVAMAQHGQTVLQGKLLNDWFSDPKGFVTALENSHWVVAGDPKNSLLLKHICSFQGPMYQVFTTDELTAIALWILGMDKSPANRVMSIILGHRSKGQLAHRSRTLTVEGQEVRMNDLFADPVAFMQGLKESEYCLIPESGDVDESPLMRSFLPGGCMARILGPAELDELREWIRSGAPLPPASVGATAGPSRISFKAAAGFSFSL